MSTPPSRGRKSKVLDGVTASTDYAYSGPIGDILFFNHVMVYLNNQHISQTVKYKIQGTADIHEQTNAEWEDITSEATLNANTSIILTIADSADYSAPWSAIRIGYKDTDSSNHGTLYAWINRK